MLGRRPSGAQTEPFGHVDINAAARKTLGEIVEDVVGSTKGLKEVSFHPDDQAAQDEVLTSPLTGVDQWFQPKAVWSLERVVKELRAPGVPQALSKTEIQDGGWSFYAVRDQVASADVVLIRGQSPTHGLGGSNKLMTMFVGSELKPVDNPLIAFHHTADAVVIDGKVYFHKPRTIERLFVNADAVKDRAPQTTANFVANVAASVTPETTDSIERICSNNANIARRVERLNRDGQLAAVTAAEVRKALPASGRTATALGTSGPLSAPTDDTAALLVDIAADLYYQPRFDKKPRRVSSFRRI